MGFFMKKNIADWIC